jgi:hypothetical protein
VLGLLADDDRLRVVAALVLGAQRSEEVAAAAGLDARRTGKALSRLTSAGLVEAVGDGYQLVAGQLREAARLAAAAGPATPPDEYDAPPEAAAVLRTFFRDGRLTSIPAVHKKRLVVLDHLATQFEPGHRYTEKEVNERLARAHPDYAALRRYLVDDGFLEREAGEYWRAGGTFQVD